MKVLRTPDERFTDLPGYPFEPNYVELDGIRVHHVDEGPRGVPPILLLHGEPTWSYLYRSMIGVFAAAGHRVIAPDLVGFGRSDKPADPDAYSYQAHVDWMRAFLFALDLREITVFGQDWGGLIGLRLAAEEQDRFARVVASNTFLPTGDRAASDAFLAWKNYALTTPEFPIGRIVNGGALRELSSDEIAAYDAPFPSEEYKVAARRFPALVPVTPEDPASDANRAAWKVLEEWHKPFLTLFGDSDPITAKGDHVLQGKIPGCAGQPHATVHAGHFIQEDAGPELARRIVDWLA